LNTEYNLIIILGPTASGKTSLAAKLASQLNTEIISADSRQVYRDMDIGTGKDLDEYIVDGKLIPFHLINIAEAGDIYNLHQYQKDFFKVYDEIRAKNKIPVLCGGTSLYINAIIKGHAHTEIPESPELRLELEQKTKPELVELFIALPDTPYKKIADTSTMRRMIRAIEICRWEENNVQKDNPASKDLKPIVFGLDPEREIRWKRIEERLDQRLKKGLIEEVQTLIKKGVPEERLMAYGLEYKFVLMHLKSELTFEQMQKQLTIAIQQFSKRQMTFFRKMEREGLNIHWIDFSLSEEQKLKTILQLILTNSPTH